jgi:hypothetical protein
MITAMSLEKRSLDRYLSFIDSNFLEPTGELRRPLAVAISRQACSRSHEIAETLIDRLKSDRMLGRAPWALFDEDLVSKVLEDHDLPKSVERYMPEDKDHELKGLINEILGVHPSLWELFHYTCDTILKLAKVGNVILIGRGAHIVTRHLPHVLHVRMIAPEAERVNRASRRHKLSPHDARKHVYKKDTARAAYIHQHFNESIEDPMAYHLILNTGRTPVKAAAAMLHNALRSL